MNHFHPVISCSVAAAPEIARLLREVAAVDWIKHGHDIHGTEGNPALFPTYFGLREDGSGGGITVRLECYINPGPGQRNRVVIAFNFCRGGSIVASVNIATDLDDGRWYAYYDIEPEFAGDAEADLPLVRKLRIDSAGPSARVFIIDTDSALSFVAEAVRFTHEHCNEPESEG